MINMMSCNFSDVQEKGLTSWITKDGCRVEFDFYHPIDRCWNLTKETGYVVRNIGLDGKASWSVFKNELEQIRRPSMLSPNAQGMLHKHYKAEKDDFEHNNCLLTIGTLNIKHFDKNDEMKEPHHFLIQHFRLVAMCTGNMIAFGKLMQLAYNAGQFEAERKRYDQRIVAFYDANKLGNIETYIK